MFTSLLNRVLHCNAKLLVFNLNSVLLNIKNLNQNEKDIVTEGRSWLYYLNSRRIDDLKLYYKDLYDSEDDIVGVYDFRKSNLKVINSNGINVLADTESKFYNIINSFRMTTDAPKRYINKLWIFGNCISVGCFAEDTFTVASYVQRLINDNFPNEFLVVNAGNWSGYCSTSRQIISPRYDIAANDIVIMIVSDLKKEHFDGCMKLFSRKDFAFFYDSTAIFERPHAYGENIIFDNTVHMAHCGYEMVARYIARQISNVIVSKEVESTSIYHDEGYINYLKDMQGKNIFLGKEIGAIVMNCNPFTLGHKYLIEEALKQCDFLYVFVVEEDKSCFKFDDRFEMVVLGTKNLNRLSIVKSGELILSNKTMPEYFTKETECNVKIDASKDLTIFSTVIARILGINKRFAGTEPYCNITNQYNSSMKEILPKYNIEFVEIERVGEISASKVRKFINLHMYEELTTLVPKTTYDFLIEKGYFYTETN